MAVYGSNNYTAAAKWCLDNAIGRADSFGRDSFCQDFYSNVVAPLNEDAKVLLHSTASFKVPIANEAELDVF